VGCVGWGGWIGDIWRVILWGIFIHFCRPRALFEIDSKNVTKIARPSLGVGVNPPSIFTYGQYLRRTPGSSNEVPPLGGGTPVCGGVYQEI
jgi:hypothetical protein